MSVQRKWFSLEGAALFNVILGLRIPGDAAQVCAEGFASALGECQRSGLASPQIVRSRIWARDGALRRVASDARLIALDGDRRASSASFIAPERLAEGIDVLIDLVAMSSKGKKVVREYEPRIAPPMFAELDGYVFLSGNTDIAATFGVQVQNICANIDGYLQAAGAQSKDIVQVDAYVSSSLDLAKAHGEIARRFPCAISTTIVAGYSAPEKLVEIEVTARRGRG